MSRFYVTQEDFDAAIEAAEHRGAEAAVAELMAAVQRAGQWAADGDNRSQQRTFIAHLSGGIKQAFPDLAIELALAAGMPNLYSPIEVEALRWRADRLHAEANLDA